MFKHCTLLLLGLFAITDTLWSQTPVTPGVKLNDANYRKIPRSTTRRGAKPMPLTTSLKPYAPQVGDQGEFATCLAWSMAYAFTIQDARNASLRTSADIQKVFYSPGFIYHCIKGKEDKDCKNGADIEHAIETIKKTGLLRYSDLSTDCPSSVSPQLMDKAAKSSVPAFNRLNDPTDDKIKIVNKIKGSVAVGNPVIIVRLKNPTDQMGHATCVVAFDDRKDGGSFEIMDSRGSTWNGNGCEWVKYDDLHVYYAVAVLPLLPRGGRPAAKPFNSILKLLNVATQKIELKTAVSELPRNRGAGVGRKTQAGHYIASETVTNGYGYQMVMDNEEDAYVYVLNFDSRKVVDLLFPHNDTTSSYISKQNGITLPSEDEMIYFDDNKGYDYCCILLSRNPLDMKALKQKIEAEAIRTPIFSQCLEKVLGEKLLSIRDESVKYNEKEGSLTMKMTTDKNIAAMIIEFEHK
jgi:Domain of unknown function (DUF4384)